MYQCAKCSVYACGQEDPEMIPKNCPMNQEKTQEGAFSEYKTKEIQEFYISSSEIEGQGYGKWVRLRETVELCRQMGYEKIGLAFCRGLRNEAKIVAKIFESQGFQVVSVICKAGGIDKTKAGISQEGKLHPGEFEPMCNPIFQAQLLNEQETQFNIALGLCVGHDSLFFRYSKALATTLVAKDRVLAHNPVGAIYCADGYYKNKLV